VPLIYGYTILLISNLSQWSIKIVVRNILRMFLQFFLFLSTYFLFSSSDVEDYISLSKTNILYEYCTDQTPFGLLHFSHSVLL